METTTAGQRFLREVASAYERSPLEIALFVAVVVIPIVLLTTYAVVKRRHELEAWTRESYSYFMREVQRLSLSPSQRETLFRIAANATKPWKYHTVFTEQPVFNRGASALLGRHEVAGDTISALRLLLGFARHQGAPGSSASLPVGARVALAREGDDTVVTGAVRAQRTSAIYIKLDEDWTALRQGRRVRILYQSGSGVFSFLTDILGKRGRIVALRHTETVGRSQRRKYYRRNISIPVLFALADWEDYAPTSTVDLGGGGAAVRPPEGTHVSAGDTVWLRFDTLKPPVTRRDGTVLERELIAVCSVVRTSAEAIHLKFIKIRESLRDRIIEQLFTDARSKTSESSHER